MTTVKRIRDNVSYLVPDDTSVTPQNISPLLEKSPGTKTGTASDIVFICSLRHLFKDEALILLGNLISVNVQRGAYDVFEDDVNVTFVK